MDYLDMAMGSANALPPEHVKYVDNDARFLPIRITHDNKQYALLGASGNNSHLILTEVVLPTSDFPAKSNSDTQRLFTVNDCVLLSQKVLGLKINEFAKLVGVSRATLDLHRKGANVKDMTDYQKVYDFIAEIESNFGDTIKTGMRNILINRKTLLQHFMQNRDELEKTRPFIEEVASKIGNVTTIKSKIDDSKSNLRLSGIGRMA